MTERLQKILARAGHGSRRGVEALISDGRVRVNGQPATLGMQADVAVDVIELDGVPVHADAPAVYLAMNKPSGFVTTARDPQHRHTVMQLLPDDLPPHVFPIGRLDRDTEGLLLFTNDGEFAHRMAHPRFEVEKEYAALVVGAPGRAAFAALAAGVELDGKRTAPAHVEPAAPPAGHESREGHVWLRLAIHEGRKRQVRRMCAAVGLPVRTLVRTRVDGIELARLRRGTTRALSTDEVRRLRRLVGLAEQR
ncbi:MAG: rRNA pseudouridine synthase [Dehalococcoidia bacterium]|nr:rRNA pseudouridine synthase [Dehalococcoidia bacterium]